jgi:phospholipid transport system substrate-binding protein
MIRQQGLAAVTALLIERSKDPVKVPEGDAVKASE